MARSAAALLIAACAASSPAVAAETVVEIAVVESHHDALFRWIDAAERGGLPREGVWVVHVDAHPDLAVPAGPVPAAWPGRGSRLREVLDIASFQLAAVRIGLVDGIVWLRPDWARQLPDGERTLQVGALFDGTLRTDDPSHYFVLADGWARAEWLREPRTLRLQVAPLRRAGTVSLPRGAPWVLDVDLDVFATRNPAADRLRAAGLSDEDLATLREIFSPADLPLPVDPDERIAFVAKLNASLAQLASGSFGQRLSATLALWRAGIGLLDGLRILGVFRRVPTTIAPDEFLWLARKVVTVPASAVATDAGIAATREAILAVVERQGRPALVTVARSADDGFTPREVVRRAEPGLLGALEARLAPVRIRRAPGLRAFDAGPGAPRTPARAR